MASIKSVVISINTEQPDGRRNVKYHIALLDDLGETFTKEIGVIKLDAGIDPVVDAQARAQSLLDEMPEQEARDAEAAIEQGDALDRVINTRWGAAKQIARRLIRYMMREKDPRIVILLEPLINYLRTNYTGAQLVTWLDITPQQGVKLNNRIDAILNGTGTVKAQLMLFDADQKDID